MVRLTSPFSTAVADVREGSVDRYLEQGWRKADPPAATTPEPDTDAKVEHGCEVCGFVAKTAAGLGAHRRRHDEE